MDLKNRIKDGNVSIFGMDLALGQIDIIHSILNPDEKRIIISACTRYGKTRAVAIATLLYILDNPGKKVLLIAPKNDQTKILRTYIAEHIADDERLSNLVDLAKGSTGERLKKEASKKRITFKNNSEIKTLTAGGDLMGFGGDLCVVDQSEGVPDDKYRQGISRMLGDSPESKLVEIINPWTRNHVWDHWNNDRFTTIKIGWEQAVKEGRHTPEFIEEQREELTDFEFQVLYEAEFPDESENSLIKYSHLSQARERSFDIEGEHIWGLDVAEGGPDFNVLTHSVWQGGRKNILDQWRWSESDTMHTVGKVSDIIDEAPCDELRVDVIGIGKGVADRLDENDFPVVPVNVGKSSTKDKDRFLNLKAQGYMHLHAIFEGELISLHDGSKKLIAEVAEIKKKHTSSGKIKIEDPDKSPDRADSLMLACIEEVDESNEGWAFSVDEL